MNSDEQKQALGLLELALLHRYRGQDETIEEFFLGRDALGESFRGELSSLIGEGDSITASHLAAQVANFETMLECSGPWYDLWAFLYSKTPEGEELCLD